MKDYYEARIYKRGSAGSEGEFYESEPLTDLESAKNYVREFGKRAKWELFHWMECDCGESSEPEVIDTNF